MKTTGLLIALFISSFAVGCATPASPEAKGSTSSHLDGDDDVSAAGDTARNAANKQGPFGSGAVTESQAQLNAQTQQMVDQQTNDANRQTDQAARDQQQQLNDLQAQIQAEQPRPPSAHRESHRDDWFAEE